MLWLRTTTLFFLLFSFWPWEIDSDQVKKKSSLEIPPVSGPVQTLRVALFYELHSVKISTPAPYEIAEFPSKKSITQGNGLSSVTIRPDPAGIRIGNRLYPVSAVRITSRANEVQVQKRRYHSAIEILKNPKGTLTVVNEIDVEDYLKGVLPGEVNPAWSEEALKAQAVISRTYAIFKNIENQDFPFTLSSDVESQVYIGKTGEQASTNRAVEKTRGEILTYRNKIFPAFFHSTCGGRTTRADYQWNIEPHPSLKGVECPFCQGSKYYTWKSELSSLEIQNLLAKKGYVATNIRSMKPEEIDSSGRPRFFVVRHSEGSLKISAHKFRLALGAERMRSTKIEIRQSGNQFVFEGKGWGHGVGLCQWGMKRLAELGYRYPDILRYYYPESEVRNLEDFIGPEAVRTPVAQKKEGNVLKRWVGGVKSYLEDL